MSLHWRWPRATPLSPSAANAAPVSTAHGRTREWGGAARPGAHLDGGGVRGARCAAGGAGRRSPLLPTPSPGAMNGSLVHRFRNGPPRRIEMRQWSSPSSLAYGVDPARAWASWAARVLARRWRQDALVGDLCGHRIAVAKVGGAGKIRVWRHCGLRAGVHRVAICVDGLADAGVACIGPDNRGACGPATMPI